MRKIVVILLLTALLGMARAPRAFALDLTFTITTPDSFTANQLTILNNALAQATAMWESALIGYQPGINMASVPIIVREPVPNDDFPSGALAAATFTSSTFQSGYTLSAAGLVLIDPAKIEEFANWQGDEPNGLNFYDELMAHEIGHALGIGTLWIANGLYPNVFQNPNASGQFQYTGAHGLAAYRAEFDPNATFVPVEGAGGAKHGHWDQRMRSAGEAGDPNPSDPFLLDPRVGVTDQYGRDRALELMTGAVDPDFLEPFLSRFTVESMRDMGYTVAKFEDFNSDGLVNNADLLILQANMGASGLQIDSIRFGDADRDRDVDAQDRALWAAAAPEPGTGLLAAMAAMAMTRRRRRR